MEIQQLLYVARAAEQMNFSKAAELCHITQSCLSQQIAKLEDEIGYKIFERTTRQVLLTAQGDRFVQQVYKVLEDIDMLKAFPVSSEEDLCGCIRIGAISSMATREFSRLIAGFNTLYPHIKLNLIQAGSQELLEKLRDETIDIAFLASQSGENMDEFVATPISTFSYFLAVPQGHRFAQRAYVKIEELRDESFVFHDQNLAMYQICLKACQAAGFDPKIVCTTTHTWFRYYMVEAGLGVGFFPYEDFLSFPVNRVSRIRLQPAIEPLLMMVTSKDSISSPVVNSFYQFIHSWFQTHHTRLNEISPQQHK